MIGCGEVLFVPLVKTQPVAGLMIHSRVKPVVIEPEALVLNPPSELSVKVTGAFTQAMLSGFTRKSALGVAEIRIPPTVAGVVPQGLVANAVKVKALPGLPIADFKKVWVKVFGKFAWVYVTAGVPSSN